MKPLRVILVDDEFLARKRLAELLAEQPGVEVVGGADDLASARALVAKENPDLVFLDISMSPESGFDLLPDVPLDTSVVFVTAHEGHALRAFDSGALDYLLKPVAAQRLTQALERARKLRPSGSAIRSVLLGDRDNWRRVPVEQITAILGEGTYSRVHTMDGGNFLMRRQLKEWAAIVGEQGFVQLDRSRLVNPLAVTGLQIRDRDEGFLSLIGCPEPLALGRASLLRAKLLARGQ